MFKIYAKIPIKKQEENINLLLKRVKWEILLL